MQYKIKYVILNIGVTQLLQQQNIRMGDRDKLLKLGKTKHFGMFSSGFCGCGAFFWSALSPQHQAIFLIKKTARFSI